MATARLPPIPALESSHGKMRDCRLATRERVNQVACSTENIQAIIYMPRKRLGLQKEVAGVNWRH
jgi:hypothetical protein